MSWAPLLVACSEIEKVILKVGQKIGSLIPVHIRFLSNPDGLPDPPSGIICVLGKDLEIVPVW